MVFVMMWIKVVVHNPCLTEKGKHGPGVQMVVKMMVYTPLLNTAKIKDSWQWPKME